LPLRKLTPEDIVGIRAAAAEGSSNAALAAIYRVSRIQIWRVLSHKQHKGIRALRAESQVQNRLHDTNQAIVRMLQERGGV
jgi:hypothetical protein